MPDILPSHRSIAAIEIENFKAISAPTRLELAPLTLLLGANGSGKSSFLKALLLLRQTADSRDQRSSVITNGTYVDLGSYSDIVYDHQISKSITFHIWMNLGFRVRRLPVLAKHSPEQGEGAESDGLTCLSFTLSYNRSVGIHVKQLSITHASTLLVRLTRSKKGAYTFASEQFTPPKRPTLKKYRPIKVYGFPPELAGELGPDAFALHLLSNDIERLLGRIFYLGPLRESPRRFYVGSGEQPQDVGLRGESTSDVLNMGTLSRNRALTTKINAWLDRFGLARQYRLERIKGQHFYLALQDKYTGTRVNLADTGFGVSQVLPVVVEALYAPKRSLLLIEQPEIHLHPSVQADLADLFLEVAREKQVVVETHSEHLLARVQRRIAEGAVDQRSIRVYFVERGATGTRARRLTLDEYGQFTDWPKGFFEEELNDRLAMAYAIARNVRRSR